MSEHKTQWQPDAAGRHPTRRPVSQPAFCHATRGGVPLDLLVLLSIPLVGVAVALILPAMRILREWFP
jgi:hypothetical protein